ncbi:DUF2505 domain-containing protein [Pseudonocardia nigra]|uniref:DUF2505 domain-containing protein n=1 Tax=Pseudonocardia nigra TaxID=1921578 RepID=UPI001C5CFCA9|nr:DUF2505 domain-containing protein [Pseudonocardia nigra]
MPRPIDYRSTSQYRADDVYATMVDPEYLRARLARLGGPRAELLEHSAYADGARYRLQHGLDAKDMPSTVRSMLPGDLTIERAESWVREESGRYAGEVQVTIHGTPASAVGGMRLHDADGGDSELLVHAEVTVKVPLIGGKIEGIVAEQVESLLAAETGFTLEWLAERS